MFIGGVTAVLSDNNLLSTDHAEPLYYSSSIIFIPQLIHYTIMPNSNLIPGHGTLWATTVFKWKQLWTFGDLLVLHYLEKKHKNIWRVSQSPLRLSLYCKITFEIIWLGSRISIYFNKNREIWYNSNNIYQLLSESRTRVDELMSLVRSLIGAHPLDRSESLASARAVTMVG